MMRRLLVTLGISLGVIVPVSFVAHPSFADTNETTLAKVLVSSTLQSLGLDDLSPELISRLTGDMSEALDAGVIDPEIRSAVASVLENPDMLAGLTGEFAGHLQEQVDAWIPVEEDGTPNIPPVPGTGPAQSGTSRNNVSGDTEENKPATNAPSGGNGAAGNGVGNAGTGTGSGTGGSNSPGGKVNGNGGTGTGTGGSGSAGTGSSGTGGSVTGGGKPSDTSPKTDVSPPKVNSDTKPGNGAGAPSPAGKGKSDSAKKNDEPVIKDDSFSGELPLDD